MLSLRPLQRIRSANPVRQSMDSLNRGVQALRYHRAPVLFPYLTGTSDAAGRRPPTRNPQELTPFGARGSFAVIVQAVGWRPKNTVWGGVAGRDDA